jgi:hypothetical protein
MKKTFKIKSQRKYLSPLTDLLRRFAALLPAMRYSRRTGFSLQVALILLGLSFVLYGCFGGGKKLMTSRLFYSLDFVTVELPPNMTDSLGRATLNESVEYRNQDNTSKIVETEDSIKEARSINDVQHLKAVTVTAKSKQRFAPERNGRVSVDFIVHVPHSLLDKNYRLDIAPVLLHNDSVIYLDRLLVNGEGFKAKLKSDSAKYAAWGSGLVSESSYDSVFFNKNILATAVHRRQDYHKAQYQSEVRDLLSWLNYKQRMQQRYNKFNIQMLSNAKNLELELKRQALEMKHRLAFEGKDTVGIASRYNKMYEEAVKNKASLNLMRGLNQKNIPKKWQKYFANNTQLKDLTYYAISQHDVAEIQRWSLDGDGIAANNYKLNNRDMFAGQMITFDADWQFGNGNIRLDTVVTNTSDDFDYYYHIDYPVSNGLKQLRVTANGAITAADQSDYTLKVSDTVSYFISSLAQLVDTTLMTREKKVYRNMFDHLTLYPKYEPNGYKFNPSYQDNRLWLDTLLSAYRRYTEEIGLQLDSMDVTAATSLDGSYDSNHDLSEKRVEDFRNYLDMHYPESFPSYKVITASIGEDWNGLVRQIRKRSDIDAADKDSILNILGRAVYPDETEKGIKREYRKAYKVINDSIYPLLRRMDITFNLSRPGMEVTDSIQTTVLDGYAEGLRLLQEREYWQALDLLANYPDYNAALCLVCLGYNGKAYDILRALDTAKVNAHTEYLMAIVCFRMEKDDEAVEHLAKALQLDPMKAYRAQIDSEIVSLVHKYDLQYLIEEAMLQ